MSLSVAEAERGWVEHVCPAHRFLIAGGPTLKVKCVCGKAAHPERGGRRLTKRDIEDLLRPTDVDSRRIYFVQDDEGAIKIGYTTTDPKRRLAALQTAAKKALVLIGSVRGTTQTERELHARFAGHRLRGEWFSSAIEADVRQLLEANASSLQIGESRSAIDSLPSRKRRRGQNIAEIRRAALACRRPGEGVNAGPTT